MATTTATSATQKPIHSIVLDTGPLIKNVVSISTIISCAEELYTTPAILSEIRDAATRSRVETTLLPFLKVRSPTPASYNAVVEFSKKTGDHAVLSKQDLGILALAYEIHCEKHGGNWGLREAPGQPVKRKPGEESERGESNDIPRPSRKRRTKLPVTAAPEPEEEQPVDEGWEQPRGKRVIKGKSAKVVNVEAELQAEKQNHLLQQGGEKTSEQEIPDEQDEQDEQGGVKITSEQIQQQEAPLELTKDNSDPVNNATENEHIGAAMQRGADEEQQQPPAESISAECEPRKSPAETTSQHSSVPTQEAEEHLMTVQDMLPDIADLTISSPSYSTQQPTPPTTDSSDSDSDGDWITPSNLSEHQAKGSGVQTHARTTKSVQMDVATMTIDFAMQNVLLQMNLNLLSTNMQRIKHLSTKVLRCHACFLIVKEMDKQFCPRCGQASLRRVSCSTNAKGEFRVHLSKNYQWNTRGDKYSVPKPIAGTANGKWSGLGGGQGGWGRDLILAEDQKEYQRQVDQEERTRTRDLMDEDHLPAILTGDRGRAGGRPKVGAGKTVNSRKKA